MFRLCKPRNPQWRNIFSRCLSTERATKDAVRRVLREMAQPVAVVTSFYPFDGAESDRRPHFHGATLSSFTSIALDPHPLVAFSLRIPSRMATSLKGLLQEKKPSLVINILSSTQKDTAIHFSRPDLHPSPFRENKYALSIEGLPVLSGSLGAFSCSLVTCLPLHDICEEGTEMEGVEEPKGGVISELFIARVLRAESEGTRMLDANALPLVYYQRQYATVRALPAKGAEDKCK